MEQIISLFPDKLSYAISHAVLHSLWQIACITFLFFIVLKSKNNWTARFKYNAAIITMALCFISTSLSFVYFYQEAPSIIVEELSQTITAGSEQMALYRSGTFSIKEFLITNQSTISALWLLGTLLLLLKFSLGIVRITNLKASSKEHTDSRLNYILNNLKSKLNFDKYIEIRESAKIKTPIVIGHLKPIVLFPIAVSNQLSMNEIEAILAHEIAHITRHDFIINLIQSLTEAVLYFHPCIWWLGSVIRDERENCCDDLALDITEDKLSYAKSLVKLQELQMTKVPALALAFSGSNHQFKNRIMRILNQNSTSNFLREKFIAIALLFTFVLTFANNSNVDLAPTLDDSADLNCELEDVLESDEFSHMNYSIVLEDDTIPEKNALIVKKKNKSESFEIKMEDGEIKELKVDGEIIPENRYEEYSDKIQIDNDGGLSIQNFENELILKGHPFFHQDEDGNSIFEADEMEFKFNQIQNMDSLLNLKMENFRDGLGFPLHFKQNNGQENLIFKYPGTSVDIDSLLAQVMPDIENFRDDFAQLNFERFHEDFPSNFNRLEREHPMFKKKNNTLKGKMSRALTNDQFLREGKNKVELSGKHMKINGEKQPSNIFSKYKSIYEDFIGATLTKDSKIVLEIDYKRPSILKEI